MKIMTINVSCSAAELHSPTTVIKCLSAQTEVSALLCRTSTVVLVQPHLLNQTGFQTGNFPVTVQTWSAWINSSIFREVWMRASYGFPDLSSFWHSKQSWDMRGGLCMCVCASECRGVCAHVWMSGYGGEGERDGSQRSAQVCVNGLSTCVFDTCHIVCCWQCVHEPACACLWVCAHDCLRGRAERWHHSWVIEQMGLPYLSSWIHAFHSVHSILLCIRMQATGACKEMKYFW